MDRFVMACAIFLGVFMLAASVYTYIKLKTPTFAVYSLVISILSFISAYLFTKGHRQGITAFYITLAVHFAGLATLEWYA